MKGDQLPSGLDLCVFDFGVNAGTGRAAKYLQKMIGATADGATNVTIGNTNTSKITFGGVEFTTLGTQTFTADDFDVTGADSTFGSDNNNISFVDGGTAGTASIDLSDGANLNINTEVGGTGAGNIAVNAAIKRIAAGDGDDALDVTISSGSGTISVEAINTGINDVNLS